MKTQNETARQRGYRIRAAILTYRARMQFAEESLSLILRRTLEEANEEYEAMPMALGLSDANVPLLREITELEDVLKALPTMKHLDLSRLLAAYGAKQEEPCI